MPSLIGSFASVVLVLGMASSWGSSSVAAPIEGDVNGPVVAQTDSPTQTLIHQTPIETESPLFVSPLEDGVYLYGQSPKRGQIGSGYAVLESREGKVIGAFYLPHSSFDCFYGTVQPKRLVVTVVDSYDQTPYSHGIALERTSSVASNGDTSLTDVGLEGYHAFDSLSEQDREMLAVCRAEYGQQVWE